MYPKNKFVTGLLAFIAGADCLDDLDDLRQDSAFGHLIDGGVASTTMGKFVRAFRLKHIENLQKYLPRLALHLREKFTIRDNHFVITMDSTPHEQCGLQMEGVEFDYANHWCLNSQNAFDQYGFCYGWHLRSGETYSGIGAELMIENIFKAIPKSCPRYFPADSAYSSLGIYNYLLVNNVNFVICLKENVWGPLLDKWEFKMEWHKTPLKFFISKKHKEINRKKKCQVASCIYPVPGLLGRSFLRVVFIRAKKDVIIKEDKRHYDYYAIVTNISETEMKNEKIIDFYRKRATVKTTSRI